MDKQYDIMDGLDEGAPGILEMLKRARNAGVECLVSVADLCLGSMLSYVSA